VIYFSGNHNNNKLSEAEYLEDGYLYCGVDIFEEEKF